MSRTSTLVLAGFALTRLRRRWRFALSMELGLVMAVALAVSATLVQSATAEIALQRTLAGLGDEGWVQVSGYNVLDGPGLAAFARRARQDVDATAGPLFRPGASFLATGQLIPLSRNGAPAREGPGPTQLELATYLDLDRHVVVVAGALPTVPPAGGDWPATISQQGAGQLGLRPGDRYCVADAPGSTFCVRVAAVWEARDPASGWWGPRRVPTGTLMLDADAYARVVGGLAQPRSSAFATFTPVPEAFRQVAVADVLDRLRVLRGDYTVARTDTAIATGLDTGLQAYWDRSRGAELATRLLTAQILLVALAYLAFASGHVLGQQRGELAVWRSRGWRRRSVWALLMLELTLLGLAALPVGLAAGAAGAALAVRAVYGTFPDRLDLADVSDLWQPALLALALSVAVLAARAAGASRRGLLEARRQASRPGLRPWWQWRQLDLALAVLGVLLLGRVPLLPSGSAAAGAGQGADPAALAVPGLGLLLLALPALRLLPLAARLAGRLGRGVALTLASLQLSRRPLQHSLLALLLLVAVALGVFAGSYRTTQRRNALDRVAYATGADLRCRFSGDVTMPPAERTGAALRGATATSLVYRGAGQPGNAPLEPTVLGVDSSGFGRVAWSRPGLNAAPLSQLVDRVRQPGLGGLPLPGRPDRVGLWVYSPGLTARLTARLDDSAGHAGDLPLGPLDYSGWRYLDAEVAIAVGRPTYPLYLDRLTIGLPQGPPPRQPAHPYTGTVAISDLGATLPGQTRPVTLATFSDTSGQSGWFATRSEGGRSLGDLRADPAVLHDGRPATPLTPDVIEGDMVIRPVPPGAPLAALAPSSTLSRLGIGLGQPFQLTVGSARVAVFVAATADHVPTLYPEAPQDFLVVDEGPLLAELSHQGEPHSWPNEVWASTTGTADASNAALLRRTQGVTMVQDRRQQQGAALADPLGVSLEANLLVGFAAALVLAVGALALHFLVAATGRRSEYAILEASGLEPRAVQRSLDIEQLVLILFSLVVGGGLGMLLAWTVLPMLHLDTSLEQTVPATVVTVDPWLTGGALAVVALVASAGGHLASRAGRRLDLMQELRTLG